MSINPIEPEEAVIGSSKLPSIRLFPHHDPRSNRPSLEFTPITCVLPSPTAVIRVGRYSERDCNAYPPTHGPSAAPIGFKSKVVSRKHCEFWNTSGQWYIKDVGSSSGTFLNHIRLSQPNNQSKPWVVNDGDILQLGIDFKGGEEMIFRCVKIRVELKRDWQKTPNAYNTSTHNRLRTMAKSAALKDSDTASTHTTECAICLMSISPCQSLFVAPCSHVWHYKCIRPILNGPSWPQFLCPNCRAVSDLEADIDDAISAEGWAEEEQALIEDTRIEGQLESNRDSVYEDDQAQRASHQSPDTLNASQPRDIFPKNPASHLSPPVNNDIGQALTTSKPTISRQEIAAAEILRSEGPMTPRNDAGPFVLDGGAGGSFGGRAHLNLDYTTSEGIIDELDELRL
ncbi:MAG: hypothetical protein M1829_001979 [Trizodia sp. TS-e1964]|nr:MAG: hypothetical protein M1829_001979 [Trizodia sp. TS-e1964]